MNEQTPSFPERTAAGGGLGGLFDDNGDSDLVTVASGPYAEQLPVANMTVGAVRARFRDRFDIDPRSQAVLGGHEVGDDIRVQPGQVLMFVRRAGEKGGENSKHRTPNTKEASSTNQQTVVRATLRPDGFGAGAGVVRAEAGAGGNLEFGCWSFLGVWCLVFGVSPPAASG